MTRWMDVSASLDLARGPGRHLCRYDNARMVSVMRPRAQARARPPDERALEQGEEALDPSSHGSVLCFDDRSPDGELERLSHGPTEDPRPGKIDALESKPIRRRLPDHGEAMLPMIRHGRGRIVNMSSLPGRTGPPLLGPYAGSKFALEALSDALRVELQPWKIDVIVIEPRGHSREVHHSFGTRNEGRVVDRGGHPDEPRFDGIQGRARRYHGFRVR